MKINNGKGVISIKTDGFVSCLIIKEPQVVDWPDLGGSIERYYACLPYQKASREVVNRITSLVQEIDSVEQFLDSGFIGLLSNGEYEFSLREGCGSCEHLFNSSLYTTNALVKKSDYRFKVGVVSPYTDIITEKYYPSKGNDLLYTQPIESLNQDRIAYYERFIQNGGRPKAIVIRNKFTYNPELYGEYPVMYSANYVLDGHHKLAAYFKLGIPPDLIQIDALRLYDLRILDYDVVPLIAEKMYPCQLAHIVTNGFRVDFSGEKLYEQFIDKFLQESTYVESSLLERMEYGLRSDNVYSDSDWVRERVRKLRGRVESSEGSMRLSDSYSHYTLTIISSWEEMCLKAEVTL